MHFQSAIVFQNPISILSVVLKAESDYCKLPLKTREEDQEELHKASASLAAAKEIRMDAKAVAVHLN